MLGSGPPAHKSRAHSIPCFPAIVLVFNGYNDRLSESHILGLLVVLFSRCTYVLHDPHYIEDGQQFANVVFPMSECT